jgi:hypothetical protein
VNIFQLIVGVVIIFVLFFGMSFILNMLLKTTYLPIIFYAVFIIVWLIAYYESGSWIDYLGEYGIVDVVYALMGLAGVLVGGLTIRKLRNLGYKMF